MKTMSYTESRARYAEVLDGVANDREEVIITRAGTSRWSSSPSRTTSLCARPPTYALPRQRSPPARRHGAPRGGRGEPHDMIDAD